MESLALSNNHPINFKSGLTKTDLNNIKYIDTKDVSAFLLKSSINSDFKGNNAIAYCVLKSIQLIKNINTKLNLHFCYPKNIIVEDFTRLKGNVDDSWGICNLLPVKLYKDSEEIIPERSILFNSNLMQFKDKRLLEQMNDIAEFQKEQNLESSSHFLIKFMHEFSHSIHEGNLQKKYSANTIPQIVKNMLDDNFVSRFKNKHSDMISTNICNSASQNPFETIAFDLSGQILEPKNINLDNYKRKSILERICHKQNSSINSLIENIWNGKYDKL